MLALMRSVRFNVGLILALAVLFVLGTFIPQTSDAPETVRKFLDHHQFWGAQFSRLGLFHIYKTPLVIGLLCLLGINIFVCRVWPQITDVVRAAGCVPRKKWGSLIAHIGFIVVLAGALVKGIWGFEEFLALMPGEDRGLASFPKSTLSLLDFRVDFYPEGQGARLFESDLRFSLPDSSGKVWRKSIRVNDPMSVSVKRFTPLRFYQASWGVTDSFKKATLAIGESTIELVPNESKKIDKTPFKVTAKKMAANFNSEENNLAVSFIFKQEGFKSHPIWLLLKTPGVAFLEMPDGSFKHVPPPPFSLVSVEPIFFSGIQIAYDPGFPIIIIGVCLILLGIGLYLTTLYGTHPL